MLGLIFFRWGGGSDGDRRKAVETILDDAHSHDAKVCFNTITEEKSTWLKNEFPGKFEITELRDYAEYLYLTSNLADLPGKKFKDKRKKTSQMQRMYKGRMEEIPLTKEHIEEVLEFDRNWIENSSETHDIDSLNLEYKEIEKQLANFSELRLSGLIIKIDGIIQGFSYGAPISGNCYDLLIEKGNRDIKHIYKVLKQDIAKMCVSDYEYISQEEDLGIPGLREAKLEYKPDILLRKYIAQEMR